MISIHVGIDIDGVLRELFPYSLYEFVKAKYPQEKYDVLTPLSKHSYDIITMFGTKKLELEFKKFAFDDEKTSNLIYNNAPIYEENINFNEVIQKLRVSTNINNKLVEET